MTATRHTSSVFFYCVAVALGLAFSGVLVVFAWNNAMRAETRNFSFSAIAARNAIDANFRTADAVIDNLASFIAADVRGEPERFARYSAGSLKRYGFIAAMAHVRLSPDGEAGVVHAAGDFPDVDFRAALAAAGGARLFLRDPAAEFAAVPLVAATASGRDNGLYLVEPVAQREPHDGGIEVAVVAIDTAGIVRALAVDASLNFAVYTESEGVAGRQLVLRKTSSPEREGGVVETLHEDSAVRLARFSIRVLISKALLWRNIDKGLVLVAAILGVGVTLLLGALARAKDLQARELEVRNRVVEQQVQQQTQELAQARDQALEASRVKSDFLASMSHEIRTPLNAIIGMAELLSESPLTNEQEKYVGVFRNAGEALLALVNDILDLSKIEAHQLTLEHIEFNLVETIEQSVDIHALKADAKGLELVVDIAPDVPPLVRGDPGRLRQVLINLVGNALKFTDRGAVIVRVRCTPEPTGGLILKCAVIDSGIGIPAAKLETIFASFTQVDNSITRRYGGTGLGLTICRRLVEMMGGRIWVESSERQGSTFHFDIGIEAVVRVDSSPVTTAARAGHVLVVATDTPGRSALAAIFQVWGSRCEFCSDGADWLNVMSQPRAASAPIELVLVDTDTAVAADTMLVGLRFAGDTTPVILLFRPSTVATGVDRLQGIAGVSYLIKPVKRGQLANAVQAALGAPVPVPMTAVAPAAPTSIAPTARILLVEDHADNRLLIKAYLKAEPYEIVEAENGVEAVEQVKAANFDLILMDVQMPVMDGYAATRAIREWQLAVGHRPTPIVALTANAIKEDIEMSRAAGCDDHLTKPIKKQILLAALRARLSAQS